MRGSRSSCPHPQSRRRRSRPGRRGESLPGRTGSSAASHAPRPDIHAHPSFPFRAAPRKREGRRPCHRHRPTSPQRALPRRQRLGYRERRRMGGGGTFLVEGVSTSLAAAALAAAAPARCLAKGVGAGPSSRRCAPPVPPWHAVRSPRLRLRRGPPRQGWPNSAGAESRSRAPRLGDDYGRIVRLGASAPQRCRILHRDFSVTPRYFLDLP